MDKLYNWVRAGPVDERINRVKWLGRRVTESDGDSADDDAADVDNAECQSLLVDALVRYSKGKDNCKVFPYGDTASKQTSEFLQVSSPTFSITLACMYPFIVNDKSKWPSLLKSCSYPIKQLWPKGVLGRYMHFNDEFHALRKEMCDAYEASGGKYHGDEKESGEDEGSDEGKEYDDESVHLDCDKDFM